MPHLLGPMIATGTSTTVASGGLVHCRGTGGGRGQIGTTTGRGGTRRHDLLTPDDSVTGITDSFPPVGLSSVNAHGSESTPNGPRASLAVNESSLTTDRQFMDMVFARTGLHILHLNVRSLFNKLDEIRLLFCKRKIAVVSFSETWLDSSISDSEIEIENYTVVRKDRNRKGGGVCLHSSRHRV